MLQYLGKVNPLVCNSVLEEVADEDAFFVADGGDFVGAASYVLKPRNPLTWLDPGFLLFFQKKKKSFHRAHFFFFFCENHSKGVFGTLGCGAGFAMATKLANPSKEVWIIWGDGAAGFSLMEFDTFVRHGIPIIAIVGYLDQMNSGT